MRKNEKNKKIRKKWESGIKGSAGIWILYLFIWLFNIIVQYYYSIWLLKIFIINKIIIYNILFILKLVLSSTIILFNILF